MSRPQWFVGLLKKAYPGRFLAAGATKLPILGDIVEHWFFDGDDLVYLPRNRVIQVNQPVEVPGDMVLASDVVENFVERANYHWVMKARDINRIYSVRAEIHHSYISADRRCLRHP